MSVDGFIEDPNGELDLVSFYENFYNSLGLIKQEGINGDSVVAEGPVPMIARAILLKSRQRHSRSAIGMVSSCASCLACAISVSLKQLTSLASALASPISVRAVLVRG